MRAAGRDDPGAGTGFSGVASGAAGTAWLCLVLPLPKISWSGRSKTRFRFDNYINFLFQMNRQWLDTAGVPVRGTDTTLVQSVQLKEGCI
ncbi:MAG TPA: hypothetical protein VFR80_08870, partial [Pyrinomonadaceae bacterium]|nr:hypothetical protein [Pyrinomonadaceae bacterium]